MLSFRTRIMFSSNARDLMQDSTLSAQLGLGSGQVELYRDAPSVPYRPLLIDLSPRTENG